MWVTDGTTQGTNLVKDIVPGSDSSQPGRLTNVGSTLFFTVSDQGQGNSILWKSDGTEAGTVEVVDIDSSIPSNSLSNLIGFNGALYFTGTAMIGGSRVTSLYISDGTALGTERLPGLGSNENFQFPNVLTTVGNELIFFGSNDTVFGGMFGLTTLIQVSATVDSNGQLDANSKGALPGGTVSFTVLPSDGFFTDTLVGGNCALGAFSGNVYTSGVINGPCSISFTHSPITYTVTATVDNNGSLDKTSAIVNEGDSVTFMVTPNTGFNTDASVTGDCDDGAFKDGAYTIEEVYDDCTVNFSHSIQEFEVNISVGKNGSAAPFGEVTVDFNASLEVQVNPDSGFMAGVSGSCGGALIGTRFTTNPVQENCDIDVQFSPEMFLVDVDADLTLGSVTPPNQMVTTGDTASFVVTPNDGINVSSVTGCDGVWSGVNPYTTGQISSNCTVSVVFVDPTAPVVADCDFFIIPTKKGSLAAICL